MGRWLSHDGDSAPACPIAPLKSDSKARRSLNSLQFRAVVKNVRCREFQVVQRLRARARDAQLRSRSSAQQPRSLSTIRFNCPSPFLCRKTDRVLSNRYGMKAGGLGCDISIRAERE